MNKCLYCNAEAEYCNCWNMSATETIYVCDKHFIDHAIRYKENLRRSKYIAQTRDGELWIENK